MINREVMTAYLNPSEQVSELRRTLAQLAGLQARSDEPDLGSTAGRRDHDHGPSPVKALARESSRSTIEAV
jgi:hypothetical protein